MLRGVLHHGLSRENLIYKLKQGATGTLALFVNLYDILTSRHLEHARNDVLRSIHSLGLCDDHIFGNACLSLNSSISPNLLDMVHGTARHLSVVKVSFIGSSPVAPRRECRLSLRLFILAGAGKSKCRDAWLVVCKYRIFKPRFIFREQMRTSN